MEKPTVALEKFIRDSDLERLEDLLAEFNLFDVLHITRGELQHSALIAWLLDPHGSHGLKDYFLRHFLLEATAEARDRGVAKVTPVEVDSWNLSDIEVATERHRIDILLIDRSGLFVCLIENKVGSDEHSNQLSRYLETVESEYEGLTPLPIYLTPDGRKPNNEEDAEHYIPFGYEKVAGLIKRALKMRSSTIGAGVVSFLEQYERTLRRNVLDTKDNTDKLAYQLYEKHRRAIDLIIKVKESARRPVGWDIIDPALERYKCALQPDHDHDETIHRFYAPSIDDVQELKAGEGGTKSGRIVLFEIWNQHGPEVKLHLKIVPGPQKTRDRLHQLALRTKPFKSRKKMAKWHSVYLKQILRRQDHDPFDPNKARQAVDQAIDNFFKQDYWWLIDAIRREFGLAPVSAG